MEKEEKTRSGSELSLEEFGEVRVGQPVGKPLEPQVLPKYLKCVPICDTNAYDLTLAVVQGLLDGIPFSTACMSAGVTVDEISTLADEHRPVSRALNYAYAQNIKKWVRKLDQGDQRAAMFYLERGVPTLFGEARSTGAGALLPQTKDVRSTSSKNIDYKNLTDAQLAELLGEV